MTRFTDVSRATARGTLLATLAIAIWGLLISGSLVDWSFGANRGAYDLEFYRVVVEEIHGGRGYYDAFDTGFDAYGFALSSVFNCRLPTCAWIIGSSPAPESFFWILLVLSLVAVLVTVRTFLAPNCGTAGVLTGTFLLMGGAFSWTLYEHDAFMATEPWCEVLILFSLCAYANDRWPLGLLFAAMALSLRELMAPYCLIAALLAGWCGRRRELLLWVACFMAFAVLYSWHATIVGRHNPGLKSVSVDYWLRPSGLRFILQSCVMNVFLRTLPSWLIAIYFPVAMIGLIGWPGVTGARLALSAGIYAVAFGFLQAGEYWGYLYSSILVLGSVRSPPALGDLWRAAFAPPAHRVA